MKKKNEKRLPSYTKLKNGRLTAKSSVNGKMVFKTVDSLEELREWSDYLETKRTKIKANQSNKRHEPLKLIWETWLEEKGKKLAGATIKAKKYALEPIEDLMEMSFDKLKSKMIVKAWESKDKKLGRVSFPDYKEKLVIILKQLDKFVQDPENKFKTRLSFNPESLYDHFIRYKDPSEYKTAQFHTEEEVERILEYLATPQVYPLEGVHHKTGRPYIRQQKRHKRQDVLLAIYSLMISTGLRGGEVCALKKESYDPRAKTLDVESTIALDEDGNLHDKGDTKTMKDRLLERLEPLTVESIEYLINSHDGEYLVPLMIRSHRTQHEFTTVQNINKLFRNVFEHAGVRYLSSHKFGRKVYATHLFKDGHENGKSFRDIAEALKKDMGHSNILTTLKYAQPIINNIDEEKKNVHGKYASIIKKAKEKEKNK